MYPPTYDYYRVSLFILPYAFVVNNSAAKSAELSLCLVFHITRRSHSDDTNARACGSVNSKNNSGDMPLLQSLQLLLRCDVHHISQITVDVEYRCAFGLPRGDWLGRKAVVCESAVTLGAFRESSHSKEDQVRVENGRCLCRTTVLHRSPVPAVDRRIL